MTDESNRIHYLYRVTNMINGKIYIGQTVHPSSRWRAHRRDSADPKVPFHYAIKKYGAHNFELEIIASCKGFDNANEAETLLVKQYDSYISNGKGYNATHGGMNTPKSEEWKQMMRDWHASLSDEEKEKRRKLHSTTMFNLIATKGHPAQGRIVTEEEKELHRKIRLENPIKYTEEIRQNMSIAHIGIKDSEETKQRKSESIKEAWEKRIDYSRKCSAPGCEVSGKVKYKIIDGIRYCNKHGLKMLRNGHLNKMPASKYTKENPMPPEIRIKCGLANIGKIAHNRIKFSEEQISIILSSKNSIKKLSREFNVTEKVIKRVKEGKY